MKRLLLIVLSLATALSFSVSAYAKDIYQNNNLQHISIHDPSIVKSEDGTYYSVGSHLAMGKSKDLINWENLGYSIDGDNYLTPADGTWRDTLAEPLEWCMKYQRAVPKTYNESNYQYNCWANDIIYNKTMKKYCLYGCCSVWGTTASAIWLCVSDNIEGPYEYVDTLIESGITSKAKNGGVDPVVNALDWNNSNVPKLVSKSLMSAFILNQKNTRGYKWLTKDGYYDCFQGMFPNAIDPTAFIDEHGEMWLVYGSYSGGCFLQKLDKNTGLIDYNYILNNRTSENDDIYYGRQISKTNAETEGTGEGPFIVYDKVSGYYYFFLTYGGLGGEGGYNIREYRSKSPDGPYLDARGFNALDEKNTGLKLDGNYRFSCQPTAYLSGGHSSCLVDDDSSIYQAYHTRFTSNNGNGHQMRIHKMLRTSDGWAVMMPFEYQGEKDLTSVSFEEVIGEYELVDATNMTQRKETWNSPWSDIVLPTQKISLNTDGTITGAKDYSCSITSTNTGSRAVSGSWVLKKDSVYCVIKLGSVTYNCVFCYQKDESEKAKTVLTFSGAGNDNSTVWGVQSLRYKIEKPNASAIRKLKKGKKRFKVIWKKVRGVNGYQIQYSTKKNFKGKKTLTVKNAKATSATIKKLRAKKKYYVRIRTYKVVNSNKYYSRWSKVKTVKTK